MTLPTGEIDLADLRLFDTWYSLHLVDRPDDWVEWVLGQVQQDLPDPVRVDLRVQLSAIEESLDAASASGEQVFFGAAVWMPRPQDGVVSGAVVIERLQLGDEPMTAQDFARHLEGPWPPEVLKRRVEIVEIPAGTAVVRTETGRDDADGVSAHQFWTVFAPGAVEVLELDFGTYFLERAEELEAEAADIMATLVLEVGQEGAR